MNQPVYFQMLFALPGDGVRLAVRVHHTDAEREWAYGGWSTSGTGPHR